MNKKKILWSMLKKMPVSCELPLHNYIRDKYHKTVLKDCQFGKIFINKVTYSHVFFRNMLIKIDRAETWIDENIISPINYRLFYEFILQCKKEKKGDSLYYHKYLRNEKMFRKITFAIDDIRAKKGMDYHWY